MQKKLKKFFFKEKCQNYVIDVMNKNNNEVFCHQKLLQLVKIKCHLHKKKWDLVFFFEKITLKTSFSPTFYVAPL